jgi:hypothetical protein
MKTSISVLLATAWSIAVAAPAAALNEDGSQAHVMQYGAKGDGINDDTVAFQKTFDQVKAGGIVVLPEGHFTLSSTVVITKPVTIIGAGFATQIYSNSGQTLFQLVNVNDSVIRDVYLGSSSTVPGVSLIELVNSHRNQINNVTMLGGYYGLHLKGSLLNTMIDIRSGTNFQGFFAPTSVTNTWVMGEPFNQVSANANTLIAPVLEGGTNGIVLTDNAGQGSINILGGTMEGVTGTALTFQATFLPSSVTGTHFEANGIADIVIQASSNIHISSVVSNMPINLLGDSRNVKISDSAAQTISIDMGDSRYPLGTGAKRIILENITACWASNSLGISPAPTVDPNFGMPNGPSSPQISNPMAPGALRKDIIYTNIGSLCGGG